MSRYNFDPGWVPWCQHPPPAPHVPPSPTRPALPVKLPPDRMLSAPVLSTGPCSMLVDAFPVVLLSLSKDYDGGDCCECTCLGPEMSFDDHTGSIYMYNRPCSAHGSGFA